MQLDCLWGVDTASLGSAASLRACHSLGSPCPKRNIPQMGFVVYQGMPLGNTGERKGSRIGQRKKLSCKVGPTTDPANPVRFWAKIIHQSSPKAGQRVGLFNPILLQKLNVCCAQERHYLWEAALCHWGHSWKGWQLKGVLTQYHQLDYKPLVSMSFSGHFLYALQLQRIKLNNFPDFYQHWNQCLLITLYPGF